MSGPEDFSRRSKGQTLFRTRVEPVFDPAQTASRECAEIVTFGEDSAQDADCVFDRALLPTVIRGAKVRVCAERFVDQQMFGVFATVVESE